MDLWDHPATSTCHLKCHLICHVTGHISMQVGAKLEIKFKPSNQLPQQPPPSLESATTTCSRSQPLLPFSWAANQSSWEWPNSTISSFSHGAANKRMFCISKVRWKGYGPEDDTWEPFNHLSGCENLIAKWEKKNENNHENVPVKK